MKERIKLIMDSENMSSARFADSLDIGRAVISHILNGRNNPSLDVITRILKHLPNIDSEWLLTGKGSMYKEQIKVATITNSNSPDLFSESIADNTIKEVDSKGQQKYSKENIVNTQENKTQQSIKEITTTKIDQARKIKQIIIYYTDNTFETFLGDK